MEKWKSKLNVGPSIREIDVSVLRDAVAHLIVEANYNIPGDGRFDQSEIPADLKLAVGRVDLSVMTCFAILGDCFCGSSFQLCKK